MKTVMYSAAVFWEFREQINMIFKNLQKIMLINDNIKL